MSLIRIVLFDSPLSSYSMTRFNKASFFLFYSNTNNKQVNRWKKNRKHKCFAGSMFINCSC